MSGELETEEIIGEIGVEKNEERIFIHDLKNILMIVMGKATRIRRNLKKDPPINDPETLLGLIAEQEESLNRFRLALEKRSHRVKTIEASQK
jgi:Mg2+/Co2+ transporter CorB